MTGRILRLKRKEAGSIRACLEGRGPLGIQFVTLVGSKIASLIREGMVSVLYLGTSGRALYKSLYMKPQSWRAVGKDAGIHQRVPLNPFLSPSSAFTPGNGTTVHI